MDIKHFHKMQQPEKDHNSNQQWKQKKKFATQFTSITHWTVVSMEDTARTTAALVTSAYGRPGKAQRFPSWDPPSKSLHSFCRGNIPKTPSICSHNFASSYTFQVPVYHLFRNLKNYLRFSPSLSELGFFNSTS